MSVSNKNILRLLTVGALAIFATGAYAQTDETAADVDARFASLEARVQSVMRANFNLMRTNSQREQEIAQLQQQVTQQQQQVTQQQQQITQQQQQIAQLQASSVDGLNEFVSVDVDQHGRPAVFFDAVNLYVRDGTGSTDSLTDSGVGNIILGYNEAASSDSEPYCTTSSSTPSTPLKYMLTEADCLAAGYEWTNNDKTGTHNLIIGDGHNYSGRGNIVSGIGNSVADSYNVVSGIKNYAGWMSVVLGASASKGFSLASILSSHYALVTTNGTVLSSSRASILEGFGTVIGSSDVVLNTQQRDVYIRDALYTPQ